MTRDVEMSDVLQDDPVLVSLVREYHLKPIPSNLLKNSQSHFNRIDRSASVPNLAKILANLVDMKRNGYFIQSMTGQSGTLMTGPWLAENLNWDGLIAEPEAKSYFSLIKENAFRPNVRLIEACLSPNMHPKEVKIDEIELIYNSNFLFATQGNWITKTKFVTVNVKLTHLFFCLFIGPFVII